MSCWPQASLRLLLIASLGMALTGCAAAGAPAAGPVPGAPPYRIYGPGGAALSGIPELVDRLAEVDFLFFGEQHDDPETHRVEEALLAELARRGRPVVVGMEMFERDVQPAVDDYLAGGSTEATLLSRARPWPNYRADYRPLLEIALRQRWPVIASNAPRHYASAVSAAGLGALSIVDPQNRRHVAADVQCPQDAYSRRFVEALQGHPSGSSGTSSEQAAVLQRYYEAQCLRDETMAESIARARPPGALMVHFNGAFHSDRSLGIVPRLERRLPGARIAVLSAIPVPDPRRLSREQRVADYVILTRQF